jgi:hypothetical protein
VSGKRQLEYQARCEICGEVSPWGSRTQALDAAFAHPRRADLPAGKPGFTHECRVTTR